MTDAFAIQIQITAGETAGRTLRLTGPSITIGRDAGCDVVIDLPFVSRMQCELQAQADQWVMVNHSSHGTRLGRRLVTDKPRPIKPGDMIRVGDESIVQLTPVQSQTPPPASSQPQGDATDESPASKKVSGRNKLWVGIGAYGVVMLALIIFFATLTDKAGKPDALAKLTSLTDSQIHDQIRKPLAKRSPQPTRLAEQLQRARELFAMHQTTVDALYRAHEAYKIAISYTAQQTFTDPIDQRRFQLAQIQLIEQVTSTYRKATNQLRARQFDQANRTLRELAAMYPTGRNDVIYRSIQHHRAVARKELAKR